MFDPNRDRSIARQLECETAGKWYELMRGTVPIQAIQAMSREQQASGRPFREVLLNHIEGGALIFVNEEDRANAREALAAAGRSIPEVLTLPGFPPPRGGRISRWMSGALTGRAWRSQPHEAHSGR